MNKLKEHSFAIGSMSGTLEIHYSHLRIVIYCKILDTSKLKGIHKMRKKKKKKKKLLQTNEFQFHRSTKTDKSIYTKHFSVLRFYITFIIFIHSYSSHEKVIYVRNVEFSTQISNNKTEEVRISNEHFYHTFPGRSSELVLSLIFPMILPSSEYHLIKNMRRKITTHTATATTVKINK